MSIKGGLGRGLDSLIPMGDENNNKNADVKDSYLLDITKIIPNPHQPRKKFNEQELMELADSITEHGVIQPLIVTKEGDNFILIVGERRLRASKLAGLREVPVIYRKTNENQKIEVALIENIQRKDLNALEEAAAYKKLIQDFSLSQEQVAKKVGKGRSTIANTLRLLSLPVEVKEGLREGKITEGHARAILALPTFEEQLALYGSILSGNLNVRQAEAKTKVRNFSEKQDVDLHLKDLENNLSNSLNTKVSIQKKGAGGKIVIAYYSDEELEKIIHRIR